MYVPVEGNGVPQFAAWDILLHDLAADGVGAFARGEAGEIDIRFNEETGAVTIGHDGPRKNTLGRVVKALDSGMLDEKGDGGEAGGAPGALATHYGELKYAIINALSREVTAESFLDGKWQAVRCGNGNVGPIEDLMPGLVDPGTERFFRFRFVVDPLYLPDAGDCSPFSEKMFHVFGESLARDHPGLRVVVNGREYVFHDDAEGLVAKLLAESGEEILMAPVVSRRGDVTLACGATRRKGIGRKIVCRIFLNGNETQSDELLLDLSQLASNWICSCRVFQSCGYDFHLVASVRVPVNDATAPWIDYVCSSWDESDDDSYQSHTLQANSMLNRCLIDVFAGMQK
jgi:hypothetical protein